MSYEMQVCPNCNLHFEAWPAEYYTCPFCACEWLEDEPYEENEL